MEQHVTCTNLAFEKEEKWNCFYEFLVYQDNKSERFNSEDIPLEELKAIIEYTKDSFAIEVITIIEKYPQKNQQQITNQLLTIDRDYKTKLLKLYPPLQIINNPTITLDIIEQVFFLENSWERPKNFKEQEAYNILQLHFGEHITPENKEIREKIKIVTDTRYKKYGKVTRILSTRKTRRTKRKKRFNRSLTYTFQNYIRIKFLYKKSKSRKDNTTYTKQESTNRDISFTRYNKNMNCRCIASIK